MSALNQPAGHGVHSADPLLLQNPGGQSEHMSLLDARARRFDVPAGHAVHTRDPSELQDPGGHGLHAARDAPLG
jgi:hypothetical protein